MDEIVDYLLTAPARGRDANPCDRAPPAPAPAKRAGPGTPDLLGLLLERLGDEAVRSAIARLIVPR